MYAIQWDFGLASVTRSSPFLYRLGVGSRRELISCIMYGPCARHGVNSIFFFFFLIEFAASIAVGWGWGYRNQRETARLSRRVKVPNLFLVTGHGLPYTLKGFKGHAWSVVTHFPSRSYFTILKS